MKCPPLVESTSLLHESILDSLVLLINTKRSAGIARLGADDIRRAEYYRAHGIQNSYAHSIADPVSTSPGEFLRVFFFLT